MTSDEAWRGYLAVGSAVGQLTLTRAEEIAKGLFASDEEDRHDAWRDVDKLARFGIRLGGQLAEVARAELARRIRTTGAESFERLWDQLGSLLGTETDQPGSADAKPSTPPPAADDRKNDVADAPGGAPPKADGHQKTKKKGPTAGGHHNAANAKKAKKKDKKHRKKEKGPTNSPWPTEAERDRSLARPGPAASS